MSKPSKFGACMKLMFAKFWRELLIARSACGLSRHRFCRPWQSWTGWTSPLQTSRKSRRRITKWARTL